MEAMLEPLNSATQVTVVISRACGLAVIFYPPKCQPIRLEDLTPVYVLRPGDPGIPQYARHLDPRILFQDCRDVIFHHRVTFGWVVAELASVPQPVPAPRRGCPDHDRLLALSG